MAGGLKWSPVGPLCSLGGSGATVQGLGRQSPATVVLAAAPEKGPREAEAVAGQVNGRRGPHAFVAIVWGPLS